MKELTAPTDTENCNSQSKRRLSRIAAVAQFLPFYAQRLDSLMFSTVPFQSERMPPI
jgi:hypothetical protein